MYRKCSVAPLFTSCIALQIYSICHFAEPDAAHFLGPHGSRSNSFCGTDLKGIVCRKIIPVLLRYRLLFSPFEKATDFLPLLKSVPSSDECGNETREAPYVAKSFASTILSFIVAFYSCGVKECWKIAM